MPKEIILTQGKITLIDDEDYENVSQFKWYAQWIYNKYYAAHHIKNGKTEFLHNFLLKIKNIDHKDGNSLNNQRRNLRVCTVSQNISNSSKQENTSSKYKGVSWNKSRNKWESKIMKNYLTIHLGRFNSEIQAALTYNKKALELFGEFARLNIINE